MIASDNNDRLQELSGSDYKIANGQPNIKGWTVKDARAQRLGRVKELIFDIESQKVKYIVLDLDGNGLELEERDVLIPIGLAELHEDDDDVILPSATTYQLQQLPVYERGSISLDIETRIREIFSGLGLGASAEAGSDYAGQDYYSTDNLLKRRIKTSRSTVIGIFDNGFDAQNSITKLKLGGFTDDQIDICVKSTNADNCGADDYTFMSNFFTNALGNKEQASHYTEIAKQGAVVTVHTRTSQDAQHAAEILDQHGTIDMDSRYAEQQQPTDAVTVGEKDQEIRARLRAKIIGRSIGDDHRLRSHGQYGSGHADKEDRSSQLW